MYRLTDSDAVIRIADKACIPADPGNRDRLEYLQWLDAGNTPDPAEQMIADAARARRDALITATDYLLMPDYPISAEQLAEVRAYRQALRDVPLQAGFPSDIDWPVPPIIAAE